MKKRTVTIWSQVSKVFNRIQWVTLSREYEKCKSIAIRIQCKNREKVKA